MPASLLVILCFFIVLVICDSATNEESCTDSEVAGSANKSDDWKLEIKRLSNGYLLTGRFSDSDRVTSIVLEEKDELLAMQELLYITKDYFGVYYSDHNTENLTIGIEKNEEKE